MNHEIMNSNVEEMIMYSELNNNDLNSTFQTKTSTSLIFQNDPSSILQKYHKNCIYIKSSNINKHCSNDENSKMKNISNQIEEQQTKSSCCTRSISTQTMIENNPSKSQYSSLNNCNTNIPLKVINLLLKSRDNSSSKKLQQDISSSINDSSNYSTAKFHQNAQNLWCSYCTNRIHLSIQQHSQEKIQILIDPYALLDRTDQGLNFLKFLYKQNLKLDYIYSIFLENLQKYTDNFLYSLQYEHCLYSNYRKDIIWYMTLLQEKINNLFVKIRILRQCNKNFLNFQKYFTEISRTKSKQNLKTLLKKHDKYIKQDLINKNPIKFQKFYEEFMNIYQTNVVQLRTLEQQRLMTIREQMHFAMNLTTMENTLNSVLTGANKEMDNMNDSTNEWNLFKNNYDDLLNYWEKHHTITVNNCTKTQFVHKTMNYHESNLLNEIKDAVNDYYNRKQHKNCETIVNKRTTLERFSERLKTIDNNENMIRQINSVKRVESVASNLSYSQA
ncbi:unnamed protein product [Didymodactylos carnosus]|uniref:Uncharacterized protein n=1 Tax=Didymodactylos carnosus TaxID=1234261 RepID=A0A813P2Y3_9BILA|nr:unnamed protein product [Didymodactylos carnosus]CAF3522894.1 unnamed protein product [Didymodactylos carnosus]